ncbi:MAG TPA: tetratricopeptide repeat protein [Actinomycetota bacterium]
MDRRDDSADEGRDAAGMPPRNTTSEIPTPSADIPASLGEKGGGQWRALRRAGAVDRSGLEAELEVARQDLGAGRLQEVVRRLEPMLLRMSQAEPALDAVLGSAFSVLGRALRGLGRDDDAAAAFGRAVERLDRSGPDPEIPGAAHDHAVALIAVGRRPQGIAAMRAAIDAQVASGQMVPAGAYTELAAALQEDGAVEEAERTYRAALEVDPDDPEAQIALGGSLAARGEDAAAATFLRDAAWDLGAANRLPEALEAVDRSLSLAPGDPYAFGIRGELLRMMGDAPGAIASLREALQGEPDNLVWQASLGAALAATGELDEARRLLERVVGEEPDYAFAQANLGDVLRVQGRFDEALRAADRALEIEPTNIIALATKAAALWGSGRSEGALEFADRALDLNPDYVFALGVRARILQALERSEEAIRDLEHLVGVEPSAPARAQMAAGLVLGGRNEEGLAMVEPLLLEHPDDAHLQWVKGVALKNLGRFQEAAAAFESSLRTAPDNAELLADYALCLQSLERREEAVEALDRAVSLRPDQAYYWALKADLSWALSRHEEALQAADRALAVDPTLVMAFVTRAQSLLALGRPEDALGAIDEALELNPDYGYAAGVKGQILRASGEDKEAVSTLYRAMELDPSLTWAVADLASALGGLGRYEEALDVIDRAVREAPDDPQLLGLRAEILRLLERHEEALADADRALVLRPDYDFVLGTKGQTLVTMGRAEEALPVLDKALEIDPEYLFALIAKASALWNLGRLEEGIQVTDRALEIDPRSVAALSTRAGILMDAADFEGGLRSLDRAVEIDPEDAYTAGLRGIALLGLRDGREREAEEAFRTAIATSPDLHWKVGLGDAVRIRSGSEAADAIYREAIADAEERSAPDANTMSLLAWCHYRLREYPESARLSARALGLDPTMISAQFDLGLALMVGGDHDAAVSEYERGLHLTEDVASPLRRRGLLANAAAYLQEAVTEEPGLSESDAARKVLGLLEQEIERGPGSPAVL